MSCKFSDCKVDALEGGFCKYHLDTSEIYGDGHCKNENGYARITDKYGNCLIHYLKDRSIKTTTINTPLGELSCVAVHSDDVKQKQHNYAELMALLIALKVGLENNTKIIYTDSVTANAWSDGRISDSIKDPVKLNFCIQASNLRKEFEKKGGIIKIIKSEDNFADFGHSNKKLKPKKLETLKQKEELNNESSDEEKHNQELQEFLDVAKSAYMHYTVSLKKKLKQNNIEIDSLYAVSEILKQISLKKHNMNCEEEYKIICNNYKK